MRYISRLPFDSPLPWPRRVAIMGSTGSIGVNTLRVIDAWKTRREAAPMEKTGEFTVTALAGGRNLTLLAAQAERWRPPVLALRDAEGEYGIAALKKMLPSGYHPEILAGQAGFAAIAAREDVDIVLSAQVGAAGLRATVAAAEAGKVICLANKESLVLAGPLIRSICARTGAVLLPVDSEHNALFQCMTGRAPEEIRALILTASGGPFRGKTREELRNVRAEHALRHPNWIMGAKITIDSATLMNKGLELIEACQLYDMPVDAIKVVVHPQSIVHSLVELKDGAVMAQLATPDMRLPIASCLSWPVMLENAGIAPLDLVSSGPLSFEAPDLAAFPCLDLARRALAEGKTAELNAANEVAVERFLKNDIAFLDIPALVHTILEASEGITPPLAENPGQTRAALDAILTRDALARKQAAAWRA